MSGFPLTIILPMITPSLNEYLNMHYIARWKLGQQYQWELIAIFSNEDKFKVNLLGEKRKVTIISHRKRLLDMDNFIGGAKPLIDALEKVRLISDDNPEFLISEYFQFKGSPERTEIIIERI